MPVSPTGTGRGRFIVLEGIDGAGTTTQLRRLSEWLGKQGRAPVTTFEPSDGPIGRYIRTVLRGEGPAIPHDALALLFAADRIEHVAREIEPALAAGADVLCDRYLGSSLAYQGTLSGLDWVREINGRALAPDLVLYLRVDPDVALARIGARDGERRELFERRDLLTRISAGYDALYLASDDPKVVVIDAHQAVDEVSEACRRTITGIAHTACGATSLTPTS